MNADNCYRLGLIVRWTLDPETTPASNLGPQPIFATTSGFNLMARDSLKSNLQLLVTCERNDRPEKQNVAGDNLDHHHASGPPADTVNKKHHHFSACIAIPDESNSEKHLFVLDFLTKNDHHKISEARAVVVAADSIRDRLSHFSQDEDEARTVDRKRREDTFRSFVEMFMGDRFMKIMEYIMRLCCHHSMHRNPDRLSMAIDVHGLRHLEPNLQMQLLLGHMGLLPILIELSEIIANVLNWLHRPSPPFELKNLEKVDEAEL
jgi:hypothetical protein